jgi:hypothetical protein
VKPDCIAAVNAAAGRVLSTAEIKGIDDRINATMRRLASTDPQAWGAKSFEQRVTEAAIEAMADMQAEAARKVANAQRQALAAASTDSRIREAQQRMGWGRSKALAEDYQNTADYAEGIKRDLVRHLNQLIDASKSSKGQGIGRKLSMVLFDVENPQMTRDLAVEIFARADGGTGNAIARAGAQAWLDVAQAGRTRFNAAGGDVGRLAYGYLPQPWEREHVARVGYAAFARDVMPEIDRSRYLREDGTRMNDAEVFQLLEGAAETIATDGANKATPGQYRGAGARANRGSHTREIHFRDGQAYLRVMAKYGSGTMYESMLSHLGAMARDIGLVERYGPNPEAQHRLQKDLAKRADSGEKLVFAAPLDAHWRNISGASGTAADWRVTMPVVGVVSGAGVARGLRAGRNIEVSSKLGSATLASISDVPNYFATAHYNKLPFFQSLTNLGRLANPATRGEVVSFLNAQGLMADSLIQSMDRFSGEYLSASMTGRLSHATMKFTLMNAWTNWLRGSYRLTHMQALGRMVKKEWSALSEWDRMLLENRSIGAEDWNVMRSARVQPTQWGDMVTPDAIYATGDPRASEIVARLLGLMMRESETAVIDPDVATRAFLNRGAQPGTVSGELARAIAQFKAFPTAMISRQFRRMLETPAGLEGAPLGFHGTPGDRLAFFGALVVTMTLAGAISTQVIQLRDGKDPLDMTKPKFWLKATTRGGGWAFFGDVLLRDSTDDRTPQQGLFELLGPTFGSLAELYELTKGNVDEAIAGRDTHAGAEAVRFAKGHAPLVNVWYTKAAFDRLVFHSIQENLSPGYLARMKRRAQREWNQQYFWEPGETAPERAPDLTAVAGE